jgi:hypothetical protein
MFILSLTSCTAFQNPENLIRVHAYEGDILPISELSTFYGHYDPGGDSVFLGSINNKSYGYVGMISIHPSIAYLKPGSHKIQLIYMWAGHFANTQEIEVNVKKGETYAIHGTTTDGKVARFWIEPKGVNYIPTTNDLMPSLKNRKKD